MPRRLVGHKATLTPLSKAAPRRPVAAGWVCACMCGWSSESGVVRAKAQRQYSQHLLSTMPICSGCKQPTPHHKMSKAAKHLCKSCSTAKTKAWKAANPEAWERHARKSYLKQKYGVTPEHVDALLAAQGEVCAICRKPGRDSRGFRPHVDHDHATGVVRGVLCNLCNQGLGAFRDDTALLAAAIEYLRANSRGAQGLWTLPPDVEARVREQMEGSAER